VVRKRSTVLLRSAEQRADAKQLRARIAAALMQVPRNELALRSAVGDFVEAEHRSGVSPAVVISRLATLIEDAEVSPLAAHLRLSRCVILWCVESYFGQVDGHVPVANGARQGRPRPPLPEISE
jgi:hypothetical protein